MRYFVTGATGFIGRRVVAQLLEAGHEVAALARDPARSGSLAGPGVTLHRGDVTDSASLRAGMEGADGVFHLAGWYKLGRRQAVQCVRVNVEGTRNVLEAMRDTRVPRGVYTSTLAVFSDTHGRVVDETYRYDGPHLSEYDRTKWAAHYAVAEPLMAADLPLVIVQPGAVYGRDDRSALGGALRQYLRRRLPVVPAGTGFCWGHVDDTARGHVLAMERGTPGETYIIAGPPHTLVDALAIAERVTGIPAPHSQVPPPVFGALAALASPLERLVPLPEAYTAEGLRTSAGVTYWGSNAKAQRTLGFAVRALEDGLRDVLPYEMQRLGIRR